MIKGFKKIIITFERSQLPFEKHRRAYCSICSEVSMEVKVFFRPLPFHL